MSGGGKQKRKSLLKIQPPKVKAQARKAKAPRAAPAPPKYTPALSIYDPANRLPPPTASSVGLGQWSPTIRKFVHSTSTVNHTLLVFGIMPDRATLGVQVQDLGAETTINSVHYAAGTSSLISSGKPGKISVTVRNNTKQLDKGGDVQFVNIDHRLLQDMSGLNTADTNAFAADMQSLDTIKEWTAEEASLRPIHVFSHPTDQPSYDAFKPWADVTGVELTDRELWSDVYTSRGSVPRPMSTLVFVFTPSSVVNTYRITIRAGWFLRFYAQDPRALTMKSIPTAPLAFINSQRDAVEQHANDPTKRGWFRKLAPIRSLEHHWSSLDFSSVTGSVAGRALEYGMRNATMHTQRAIDGAPIYTKMLMNAPVPVD